MKIHKFSSLLSLFFIIKILLVFGNQNFNNVNNNNNNNNDNLIYQFNSSIDCSGGCNYFSPIIWNNQTVPLDTNSTSSNINVLIDTTTSSPSSITQIIFIDQSQLPPNYTINNLILNGVNSNLKFIILNNNNSNSNTINNNIYYDERSSDNSNSNDNIKNETFIINIMSSLIITNATLNIQSTIMTTNIIVPLLNVSGTTGVLSIDSSITTITSSNITMSQGGSLYTSSGVFLDAYVTVYNNSQLTTYSPDGSTFLSISGQLTLQDRFSRLSLILDTLAYPNIALLITGSLYVNDAVLYINITSGDSIESTASYLLIASGTDIESPSMSIFKHVTIDNVDNTHNSVYSYELKNAGHNIYLNFTRQVKKALTGWKIGLIVVAICVFFVIILTSTVFFLRNKRKKNGYQTIIN